MASNSPFSSGSSVSSILKGAQSTANQIATYNDSIAAYDYENSGHTDAAYTQYKKYLLGRIDSSKGGDLTSQQRALTLTKTLQSATHANVSANIQRENIQIMAGGANLTDKYNLISNQYSRAVSNGDYTLAQSLESQAYSVSQQIQYQQQTAANAAASLAKAGESFASSTSSANARAEGNVAKSLEADLAQFNYDYKEGGQKTFTKMESTYVKKFAALGVVLPPGVQPNYSSLVEGFARAINQAYNLAGDVAAPYASDAGQSYYDKANSWAQTAIIPTVYGKMTAAQVIDMGSNPNNYSYDQAPDFKKQSGGGPEGQLNPQVGYSMSPKNNDGTGGIQPIISKSPWIQIPANMIGQFNALGLQTVGKAMDNGNAYTVHATDKSPDWLRKILPTENNSTTVAVNNNQTTGVPNALQFEADSQAQGSQGKAVYTITTDQSGKKAVYESSNMGDRVISSDPGYDFSYAPNAHDYKIANTPQMHQSFWSKLGSTASAGLNYFADAIDPHASAAGLTQAALIEQQNAIYARQQANQNIKLAPPPTLPKLSLAAPRPINQPQPQLNVSSHPIYPAGQAPKITKVSSTPTNVGKITSVGVAHPGTLGVSW